MMLFAASALFVPLAAVVLAGNGSIPVRAELDAPYTVVFGTAAPALGDLDGDRTPPFIGVTQDGVQVRGNLPIGEERRYFPDAPAVQSTITVTPEDTDARAVLVVVGIVALAAIWVVVLNLGSLVEAAAAGDPFDARNPMRLRRLAALAVAVPLITRAGSAALDRTLDVEPPFRVLDPGPSWLVVIVVAAALAALAEVFRTGSAMRDRESLTV